MLLFSKVSAVIPEDIGATAYTTFATFSNLSELVAPSIGLKLTDIFGKGSGFYWMVLMALGAQVGVNLGLLWGRATEVDLASPGE